MDANTFLIQVLNGVQYGLLLFLVASGLTLILGIMGIINLAHGSFYMVGAYLAFSLSQHFGSLWLAMAGGVVIAVAIGLLLEWLLISRLYHRDHLYQVLLTYGLILIFEELRSVVFGDDVHGVAVPALLQASIPLTDTLSYPVYRLWMSAVCLALAVGMSVPPVASVFPGMGNQVLIVCFVVVVIGGIGSVKGAMLAAILIGLVDTFGKVITFEIGGVQLLPELSAMMIYVLMAVVLLARPEGLFGKGG